MACAVMTTPWGLPDFDAHEDVHFFTDEASGLKAIIADPFDASWPRSRRSSFLALCEG